MLKLNYLAAEMLRKLLDTVLYSNVFIGLCAVGLVLANQLTVSSEMHFDISCWFVFFSTVFTYSYLKITNTDDVYETTHRNWAAEHQQLARNIMLLSLIAAAAFFLKLPTTVKWEVVGIGLFTAFYGFVEIPFVNPPVKLRRFGLAKTLFVAIVWSVTTVLVPMYSYHLQTDMMVFLLIRRFLFLLALTIAFEVKDIQGDMEYNLRTIPLVVGITNTKLLAQGILLLLIIINVIQYVFFDIGFSNMLAVNLSLVVSILCIQPVGENTHDKWYYLVLDGMMILQFV
ncbi:MAG TPA: hypothetical protein VG603_01835, partial [Chitinophagales bacterium]|nr:hypothetical protein [Chitinophagales bacterium]